MYKLSIIIPVYNAEKYLTRCLDSVTAQKYPNLEIIVVDDGSTDGSPGICDEYAKKDKRITVCHKENGGAGTARKEGLIYTDGDYITCVDADDWIEGDAYGGLMDIANTLRPDLIACSFIKEFGELQAVRQDYPEEGYYTKREFHNVMREAGDEMPFFCQVICGSLCCKIFKREYFERFQNLVPGEIVLSEDLAVVLPMIMNVTSVYVSKTPYYHYCQNKESSSWAWRTGEYQRLITLAGYLKQYYDSSQDRACRRLILHSIYFAMMDLLYDIPGEYFKDGIPFLKDILRDSRVVVYGKGVFAANLVEVMHKNALCRVVLNVDSADADRLFALRETEYDFVVIAILDYMIVEKVRTFLLDNHISGNKIFTINKADLTAENLPVELKLPANKTNGG